MSEQQHDVPLHQVLGDAIQNRLRDFRVEENLQIYYPPPEPVAPEAEPDVPEQASGSGSSVSDPARPGLLPDPQSEPVASTQPRQPVKGDVGGPETLSVAELRDIADRTWTPPVASEVPQKASAGRAPDAGGSPSTVSSAAGSVSSPQSAVLFDRGVVQELSTVPFRRNEDVAHAEIWSPPVQDAQGPEAMEASSARDVASPGGIGGERPAGGDPTSIPSSTGWLDLDRLRSEVTTQLVDAAVPMVVDSVEKQLSAFTDMIDEKIHELDQRFLL